MAVLVRIPTPLRTLTKGAAEVQADASTVTDLIDDARAPVPRPEGAPASRTAASCAASSTSTSTRKTSASSRAPRPSLKQGDEVSIVPAIAGGR